MPAGEDLRTLAGGRRNAGAAPGRRADRHGGHASCSPAATMPRNTHGGSRFRELAAGGGAARHARRHRRTDAGRRRHPHRGHRRRPGARRRRLHRQLPVFAGSGGAERGIDGPAARRHRRSARAGRPTATRQFDIVSSLAGRVPDPALPVGPVRIGGFGGVDGLRNWLRDNGIDTVVDATHPYAATITANAAAACADTGTAAPGTGPAAVGSSAASTWSARTGMRPNRWPGKAIRGCS